MLFIIVVTGAGGAVYMVGFQGERFTPNDENTSTATQQTEEKKESLVSVRVRGGETNFSMGSLMDIEYTVSEKTQDEIEDFTMYSVLLNLVDSNGKQVGIIDEYPSSFGERIIQWDPSLLTQNGKVQAPTPGQYRVEFVLQKDGVEVQGSEYKAQTTAFQLSYDTITSASEFPFASCGETSRYATLAWNNAFVSSFEREDLEYDDINVVCYSEAGQIAIAVIPAAGKNGYPVIVRFNISNSELKRAIYKNARDIPPTEGAKVQAVEADVRNKSATVGSRSGALIPIKLGGSDVFRYNYIENSFEDVV